MRTHAACRQARRGLDHDLVALHDAQAGDHADQRTVRPSAEARVGLGITRPRMVALGIGAARQRGDAVRIDEAGGDVLAPDGFGHRHHERGAAPVEPAVGRVGPHRLRDVTRPHDGARRGNQAVRHGGQPVLLAAMHVDHVHIGQHRPEAAKIAAVGHGMRTARQGQRGHTLDAFASRPIDHARLGSHAAAERHQVAAPLELPRDPGRPVRVGRPSATGHQLENLHQRP